MLAPVEDEAGSWGSRALGACPLAQLVPEASRDPSVEPLSASGPPRAFSPEHCQQDTGTEVLGGNLTLKAQLSGRGGII